MTNVFKNDNGRVYNVLATLEFNEADKKEFMNSWQNTRAMLLEDTNIQEYVVAQYVGEPWGMGGYYDDLADATERFNEVVARYNRV